ncbi:AcrR family transcriptional regulator [Streptomyces griseochromogenes]|uniref:AcrR family transcriptional regulator n=1 Tax=Streptomyces griseochromogenes TaxID=68214 RepID=A0A1B1AXU0_9ACTN|nr:TetR/AcrR family transcriptional regulator C-terminal domain-containing protein [Streptomyces griseochromogenes]ANP51398.1 GntR family transcriptional regulator [Streptomyces griseochromogenes]MBP2049867.1 AcrR family transcriptional regulator [Streptomyces griseochromogenes]
MSGQAVPRYRQIVDELRRQIETGELAPGDRVPSTREITKQWGVAMATATKVLTELRREGMVHAMPGVGTVVEAPSRRVRNARPTAAPRPEGPPDASSGQAALTLERIVVAAVTVADTEGLAAVSMRRVAAELGVATMSLYRHVADKDDLLMRMMDTVIAEHPLPADPPAGWREAIELAARQLWDLFRRHPWLAPALSVTRPQMITSALPYSEWMLGTLHAHGLDLHSAFTAHLMLLNYARGIAVNLEAEREAEAHSGLDSEEWMDTQEPALLAILATGRFPALSRLATTGYDFDLDAVFEFGLQRLLDGLAPLVNESSAG